ncbi:hypothetical protein ANCDUO_07921 [Ancylostoma duodenale]|uniref:Glycogen debranching enzyme central domain-containing protein n=1 Tax=Ancylostoma duodenale TaxID=51022 RepID=A0A0C2GKR7_9BILA|nr:hypothetical protein ANCDUO_07921 [Ancylostoma duodenale]
MSYDVVGITRHNPVTHDTIVVVSHTAFNKNDIHKDRVYLKHIPIGGILEEILFEMRIDQESPEPNPGDFLNNIWKYILTPPSPPSRPPAPAILDITTPPPHDDVS